MKLCSIYEVSERVRMLLGNILSLCSNCSCSAPVTYPSPCSGNSGGIVMCPSVTSYSNRMSHFLGFCYVRQQGPLFV